ncbi:MAG TPA: nucleoside transporter C-terminal domain-containing protein [Stellaceae bacterium]|jgi:CNT family concentrative nucleoside transporter|nr:nucleoside transporter C-terminal domain-containing protein [Stellaceae bacterium]
MRGLLGIAALLLLAWILSEDRFRVPVRVVIAGLLLQVALAIVFLKFPPAKSIFLLLNKGVTALQIATDSGTSFVFGYLGGGSLPFAETKPGAAFIFAFRALPMVLLVSALATLLFYWGVLQRIVQVFAWVLRRVAGIGGALGLGAAVHIFVGHIEGPLLIRPYLLTMERGELFAVMSCGMAGIAGTVMVLYAAILGPVIPDALGNILVAAIISTPAALSISALMVPFRPDPSASARLEMPNRPSSSMDAIARGTQDGIVFFTNIVAMLVVLIALVTLVNLALGELPQWGGEPVTLQRLFAYAFRPVMWLIGIPGPDVAAAADLMGTKTVLNEFIAYVDFAKLPDGALSQQSRLIMTYAMCGFANFGSLGILIGGMGAMVPERRQEIVSLGLRSILSGTIATCMSGAVVGML